jgi:hypothetical protein
MTGPQTTGSSTADDGGADDEHVDIDDLCFTARALAQTHPMTATALRYKQRCFEDERSRQHVTDLADWATTALLVGYCLRRAEERDSAVTIEVVTIAADGFVDPATTLAERLRDGDADSVTLFPADITITAIDRIIGTEIHKRDEHMREQLSEQEWTEFEQYITWWVIHGYCVRAVETVPT